MEDKSGNEYYSKINEIVFNAPNSVIIHSPTQISEVDSTTGIYCSRGMDIDGNANVDGNVTIGGFTTLAAQEDFQNKIDKRKNWLGN